MVLGREMPSRIEVLDAHWYAYCLTTRGLKSVLAYDIDGTTDVLLAYSQAVKMDCPESGCVAAFELRKGQVSPTLKK